MGLFDFVDKVIGSDFSGNKARGEIDAATSAANAGNAQAAKTMELYGDKAKQLYQTYIGQGMDAVTAANKAARDSASAGYAQGEQTYRDLYGQAQSARTPYNMAGLSMLQALPQLQAALGLTAYNMPTSMAGNDPNAALTQYTGGYDVAASPLYQWQMQQMDDKLKHQLAAMGINNDAAAALIRSQNVGQLGAEERQRQIADLQNLVSGGLGVAQGFGQLEQQAAGDLSGMQINAGLTEANLLNQGAMARGTMAANLGQLLGQTELGVGGNIAQGQIAGGQNALNAGLSKAQIPNGMNQLVNTGLQLYGMGAFGGGNRAADTPNLGASTYRNIGQPFMYGLSGIPGLG
jgi:hypothetical protein